MTLCERIDELAGPDRTNRQPELFELRRGGDLRRLAAPFDDGAVR